MFKKAKLYSLLLIIVASTVVGLFGVSRPAQAQSNEKATWSTTGERGSSIQYEGDDYLRLSTLFGVYITYNDDPNDCFVDSIFDNDKYFGNNDNVFVKRVNKSDGSWSVGVIHFSEGANEPDASTNYKVGVIKEFVNVNSGATQLCNPGTATWVDFESTTTEPDDEDFIPDDQEDEGAAAPKSCQIKGIGWLICPVVTFLAEVTDSSYWLLDRTLLKLEPIMLPGGGSNDQKMRLYDSWRVMRDFSNVIFIAGFLIIVFSQITNIGVSNYGIKRLLPKIIVAAILVNLSYYICALGVDISNILGNQLRGVLMPGGWTLPEFKGTYENVSFDSTGFAGITGVILGAVASAAIVYAFLPVFLPLVISAAVAVFTVVVALTIRQAMVVILIVISPLAFVALLLPNTESYFQKWKSLFIAMLMVYPIISVIFGASALASNILMTSTDDFWVQMVGAGVSIIPLFITPIVMKVSGGLLNRFVGIVNDPTKGFVDSKRNALDQRGKIIAANKRAGSIRRTGNMINSTRGRMLLGGANSRRRRALALGGGAYKELERKDRLSAAESGVEGAYLGTESGRTARNEAKNAQINLQNAQLDAETVRLQAGSEGFRLEHETMLRERRQKAAENEATTAAENTLNGSGINNELKQSEVRLHTAQTLSQAASTAALPHDLEAQSIQADLAKEAAEDESRGHGLDIVASTADGQAALAQVEDAKNAKLAAEKTASAVGQAGADRATAARAEDAALGEKIAKDNLAEEVAPLVSQTARVMAKSAETKRQTAESQAETGAINTYTYSAAGQTELGQAEDAKNQKTAAENDSKSIGIAMADEEFKVQAATSAEVLSDFEANDKRLYEEVVAGEVPAGINPMTAAGAQAVREMSTITREATASAKGVSDDALSERVLNDPTLAAEMGGIDPNGELAARTKAAASLSRSHKETVDNHLALLVRERVSGSESLTRTQDETIPIEETEANAINVAKYGSDTDIMSLLNYAGSLPTGDNRKIAILQQYADNIGNRNVPAIGQGALEQIRNGDWNGNLFQSWRDRTQANAFSGAKAATMSEDHLRSQLNALMVGPRSPELQEALEAYVQSIRDYRDDLRIKQPEKRITDQMDNIVRLVDPAYTPSPRS